LLGLPTLHLLFELRAERLQLRFEKSDVATHYAEMGNLLSLNPKIHRLGADAEKLRSLTNSNWKFPPFKLAAAEAACGTIFGAWTADRVSISAPPVGVDG